MQTTAPRAADPVSLIGPGTRLGRYEIITHLASGGMATVYLGRVLGVAGFQRLVAIKSLHPHIAADQQFVTMFLDEARLAARIRHPNVVPTLDLERGAEGLYLVMEFVEGDSLLGLLRATVKHNKPIPAGIVLRIMLDVLQGLEAAHEQAGDHGEPLNLVHRDVSPHNIMVGLDGVTRLTDFGIARAEERIGNTRDGQLKGKLSYMAPEQTTSDPVDRRVDIFTAGIVLWECLASKRLFRGNTDAEVLRNLLDSPIPRLRDVSPGYPQALDDVVARALRRDPSERFDTAAEFAEALEEASEGLGIASPKAVGAYVRAFVGDTVDDVRGRVRAWMENPRSSQVPPAPVLAGDDSKVRARAPDEATTAADGRPMPARYPSSPDTGTTHTRRPVLIAVAAAGLVLIGASVATATLLLAAHNSPPAPVPAPTSLAPATGAGAGAVTPTESILDLPVTTATAAPVRVGGARVGPKPPPVPPPPRGTATGSAGVTPAPTSSTFNPESM